MLWSKYIESFLGDSEPLTCQLFVSPRNKAAAGRRGYLGESDGRNTRESSFLRRMTVYSAGRFLKGCRRWGI